MSTTYPGSAVTTRSRFPEGNYYGEIAESKDDTNPDGTMGSFSFRLIKNTAANEDTKEPGGKICFVRIPTFVEVQDKRGKSVVYQTADVGPEEADDEDIPFGLRNAVGSFLQLAAQVGRGTVQPDGGIKLDDDLETFIEECRGKEFDEVEVEFIVEHRSYTAKRGPNKGNKVNITDVSFPLPEEGEGGEEPDDPDEPDKPEDKPGDDPDDSDEPEPEPEPTRRRTTKKAPEGSSLIQGAKAKERSKTTKATKGSGRKTFKRRK